MPLLAASRIQTAMKEGAVYYYAVYCILFQQLMPIPAINFNRAVQLQPILSYNFLNKYEFYLCLFNVLIKVVNVHYKTIYNPQ